MYIACPGFYRLHGGIYRSSIQSPIWTAYNEGLTNLNVNFIYGSNNYLYAGITYGGFFRRHANISISIKNNSEVCKDYSLFQNYPNPFNPTTNIKYQITNTSNVKSEMSNVKLIVYDILGKEIITLVNDKQSAGIYEVTFDGSRLASGIYFYKLQSGDFTQTRKMVLLK
ncbi:MAG: T9SS type A sorting domain-containing protein [Ignavibacteriae bacterium]|nr:T9SS type A sorting domain-containing protein [Ignavibacteriota bacterium]